MSRLQPGDPRVERVRAITTMSGEQAKRYVAFCDFLKQSIEPLDYGVQELVRAGMTLFDIERLKLIGKKENPYEPG